MGYRGEASGSKTVQDDELSLITNKALSLRPSSDFLVLNEKDVSGSVQTCCRLAGKIIVDRVLPNILVHSIVNKIWVLPRPFSIEQIADNLYLFNFTHEADKRRILDGTPWLLSGHLLLLKDWPPDKKIAELDFSSECFWLQVHGLPLSQMTKSTAEAIGSLFYGLEEMDSSFDSTLTGGSYMRIRIRLNITDSLKAGFYNVRPAVGNQWVDFKFERLPDFCFWCGKLGHTLYVCASFDGSTTTEEGHPRELPFGPYMRARPPTPSRKPSLDGGFNAGSTHFSSRTANQRWSEFSQVRRGSSPFPTPTGTKVQSDGTPSSPFHTYPLQRSPPVSDLLTPADRTPNPPIPTQSPLPEKILSPPSSQIIPTRAQHFSSTTSHDTPHSKVSVASHHPYLTPPTPTLSLPAIGDSSHDPLPLVEPDLPPVSLDPGLLSSLQWARLDPLGPEDRRASTNFVLQQCELFCHNIISPAQCQEAVTSMFHAKRKIWEEATEKPNTAAELGKKLRLTEPGLEGTRNSGDSGVIVEGPAVGGFTTRSGFRRLKRQARLHGGRMQPGGDAGTPELAGHTLLVADSVVEVPCTQNVERDVAAPQPPEDI